MPLFLNENSIFYHVVKNILKETSKNLIDAITDDDIMYFLQKRVELLSHMYNNLLVDGNPSIVDPFFLIKKGATCGPAGCTV